MTATKKISSTFKKKVIQKKKITAVSLNERHRMIAEAAYFKAKQRNFLAGDPHVDWLNAEMEIDAQISSAKQPDRSASI